LVDDGDHARFATHSVSSLRVRHAVHVVTVLHALRVFTVLQSGLIGAGPREATRRVVRRRATRRGPLGLPAGW